MLVIRLYQVVDEIVATLDYTPTQTGGWPQVAPAPHSYAYIAVAGDGHETTPDVARLVDTLIHSAAEKFAPNISWPDLYQ